MLATRITKIGSFFLRIVFTASIILLAACGEKSASYKEKVYLVATDASYPPFESINANNDIVGFNVDLLKAVAEKAGIKVQFIDTPWEGIFNALAAGDRDLVMSSVTITDERRKNMDFSNPYFEAQQRIVTRVNSPILQLADLKNKKVAVQNATTGDIVVQGLLGKNNPHIKRFDTTLLALQEMLDGGVDAVVGDKDAIDYFVKQNPKVSMKILSDPSFSKEYYGYAVKKGNTALLDHLNKGLKAVQEDGTFERLYARYFTASKG